MAAVRKKSTLGPSTSTPSSDQRFAAWHDSRIGETVASPFPWALMPDGYRGLANVAGDSAMHAVREWVEVASAPGSYGSIMCVVGGSKLNRTRVAAMALDAVETKALADHTLITPVEAYWTVLDRAKSQRQLNWCYSMAKRQADSEFPNVAYRLEEMIHRLEARRYLCLDGLPESSLWDSEYSDLVDLITFRLGFDCHTILTGDSVDRPLDSARYGGVFRDIISDETATVVRLV